MENLQNFTFELNNKKFILDYYSQFYDYYAGNGVQVEPRTRKWFWDNLTDKDVVFDIGAHIGFYTILFLEKTPHVYSFEPTKTFENLLIPNLQRNNIDIKNVEKIALGNFTGKLNDKIFRIWGNEPELNEYDFIKLDDYISKNKIYPSHLKIDVDGYDFEVLKGGEQYLKETNVTVCVEVNKVALQNRNFEPSNILDFMSDLKYNLIGVFDDENYIFKK